MAKPTLNFYMKALKEKFVVMGRITVNRKKSEFATDILVDTDSIDSLNRKQEFELDKIREGFQSLLAGLSYNGIEEFDSKLLRDKLLSRSPKKADLIQFLKNEQIQYKQNRNLKDSSKQLYLKTLEYLLRFIDESEKKKHYPFDLVNEQMIRRLDDYLNQLPNSNLTGSLLSKGTIAKHHSRTRSILFRAYDIGLLSKNPYQRQKFIKSHAGRITHLKQHELELLKNAPIGTNRKLDLARDYFLFTVYSGLRYSDVSTLKRTAIYNSKDQYYLSDIQQKTGDSIDIPLLDGAVRIFEKYAQNPECEITGLVLPKLSNQKLNEYLKSIQEIAGIETLLTHHVARHTCATFMLSKGVSIVVVQRVLGHSELKTTQRYAKLIPEFLNHEIDKVNGTF